MGANFYLHADLENGARWAFERAELEECLVRHWPGARTGEYPPGRFEIEVEVAPGRTAELWYQVEHGIFGFADRRGVSAALALLHTVLNDLAPDVPAVVWCESDYDPLPVDLTVAREVFALRYGE